MCPVLLDQNRSIVEDIIHLSENVLDLHRTGTFDYRLYSNIYRFATDSQKEHILEYANEMLSNHYHLGDFRIGLLILGENFTLIQHEAEKVTNSSITGSSLYKRAFIEGVRMDSGMFRLEAITFVCEYFACCGNDDRNSLIGAIQSCLVGKSWHVIKATLKGLQTCIHLMTSLELDNILSTTVTICKQFLKYKNTPNDDDKLIDDIISLANTTATQISTQYLRNYTKSGDNVLLLFNNTSTPTIAPSSYQDTQPPIGLRAATTPCSSRSDDYNINKAKLN